VFILACFTFILEVRDCGFEGLGGNFEIVLRAEELLRINHLSVLEDVVSGFLGDSLVVSGLDIFFQRGVFFLEMHDDLLLKLERVRLIFLQRGNGVLVLSLAFL